MKHVLLLVAFCVFAQEVSACSYIPSPSLLDSFKRYQSVYLARLVQVVKTPAREVQGSDQGVIETATFRVVATLKGPRRGNQLLRTQTPMNNSCAMSANHPLTVIGDDGKDVENPFSDMWLLFLEDETPYVLRQSSPSLPINLYKESDLLAVMGAAARQ
jgi:hypothetical protein